MDLGRRYKKLRLSHDFTQAELAETVGCTRTTVAKWEAGENLPRAKELRKLARLFNVSSDYLIGLTDDPANYRNRRKEVDNDK